jgi:PAS domain S-box-containing protein
MFGYKREDLINKNFTEIVHLEEKDMQRFLEMLVKGEAIKNFEMKIKRKKSK